MDTAPYPPTLVENLEEGEGKNQALVKPGSDTA